LSNADATCTPHPAPPPPHSIKNKDCYEQNGDIISPVPSACFGLFCYVDPNHCNGVPLGALRSLQFPDTELYYSYTTCGNKDVYSGY
jgi:hypothetical protein